MKVNQSKSEFKVNEKCKIAIVLSRYNDNLGNILLENTLNTLKKHHLTEKNFEIYKVPGALEIPLAVNLLTKAKNFDAIITLGIVIRGDTYHFELVCNETYRKLMNINTKKNLPIIFGILTVNTIEQAEIRVDAKKMNKGAEFAEAALEMIAFKNILN